MLATLLLAAGMAALVAGTLLCVLGTLSVLRLSDTYSRIQAAGLVITGGAGGVLLAVVLLEGGRTGLKALATAGFLLLTAPLVTHVLARGAYRQGIPLGPYAVRDDLANQVMASGRDDSRR
jgi:multicomponent Na+:H+ antiporter subunit G